MKALVIHGPGEYRVEDSWPQPQVRPGWALVRVRYAGVCGSDLVRFASTGSYHHPMVLGHEFAGTVAEPAPGSERFPAGTPVAVLPLIPCGRCAACRAGEPFHCGGYLFLGSRIDGGFAEYCLVPEENLFALPAGVELRAGAFIEPMAVGLHCLRRAGFRPGQSALVLGAGSIGLLIGLWLKVFSASRVALSDLRAESLATAARLGFTELLDARLAQGAGSSFGQGFEASFEAAGSSAALAAAIEQTRDRGVITVVGRDTADTRLSLASFERLMRKELSLRGCWGYNLSGEEAFLYESLRQGRLPVTPMISHQVPLAEAPALIRAMASREIYFCKALIEL